MYFHDTDDHRMTKALRRSAPGMVDGFMAFDQAVFAGENGTLPARTKELIAVGVAATTQCPYCIDAHVKAAKKVGASREEVSEAVMIAAAIRAGGAFTHGWLAIKCYDD